MRATRLASLGALWLVACGSPEPDWRAQVDAWRTPEPIPDLALVDHHGAAFHTGALSDRWVLVAFVYTRCPIAEACPATMQRLRAAWDAWQARPGAPPLHVLAITLDPTHDTPERLAAFGARHGVPERGWTLATGPVGLVDDALPSMMGVLTLPKGDGDVSHTVKIALVRPGWTIAEEWVDGSFSTDAVLRHLATP